MLQLIKKNMSGMYAYVITLFIGVMFLTFDSFGYTTITTETPLIKIGELPFLRMEFTTFLFALTAIIGALVGILLSKKLKKYSPICLAITAAVTLFIALFDVNALQILVPDMRISHVAMTLSRLSAIALGACGLFIGIAVVTLPKESNTWKYALSGIITAMLLSLLAVVESWYLPIYICVAIVLFALSICGEFIPTQINSLQVEKSNRIDTVIGLFERFITISGMCMLILPLSAYLINTLQMSIVSYIVLAGSAVFAYLLASKMLSGRYIIIALYAVTLLTDILLIFFASRFFVMIGVILTAASFGAGMSRHKQRGSISMLVTVGAFLIGAIFAYIIVHDMSEVIKFSNNRIIYALKDEVFIIFTVLTGIKAIIRVVSSIILPKYTDYIEKE